MFAARHESGGVPMRGFTLLECLIVVMLSSLLAVGTLRVLADARMVRSNARDRLMLATLAQAELDRLRLLPAGDLRETTQTLTHAEWPEGVMLQVATAPYKPGIWQLDVLATRRSVEGKPSVRLLTLSQGIVP